MLENIKKVDRKILTMLVFLVVVIVIIIIAVICVLLFSNRKLSYSKIEDKIKNAAVTYYGDHKDNLPEEVGETSTVTVDELVSNKYVKDLSKYTAKGVSCGGRVVVRKTVSGYDYVPFLSCGKAYESVLLSEKLIDNVVTEGNGLYEMSTVVRPGISLGYDEEGYDLSSNELMRGYIFRGEKVDNYLKLASKTYRIVKIDGNGDFTVYPINLEDNGPFDNRYNSETKNNYGINDYRVSRAYEYVSSVFQKVKPDSVLKSKVVAKNLCIGSRKNADTATDGSLECSKVMKNQYFGLLSAYDVMNASISTECTNTNNKGCQNYNYLMRDDAYWTLTPTAANSYRVYGVNGAISLTEANNYYKYKYIYFLSGDLVYVSGTGTYDDPYIVR